MLQIDDEWRRWIAENLLIGAPKDSILGTMTGKGFDPQEASAEIDTAMQSPYVRGATLLQNRLKKRDWLLATYRKSNRLHSKSATIERRHKLSRHEFFDEYYTTGRPVIITGMMDDWPAMKKWSLDYFTDTLGSREVEVMTGRNAIEDPYRYELDRHKHVTLMRFDAYVEKIRNAEPTNDFYMTAANESLNKRNLPELWDDIVLLPEYLDQRDPLSGFLWLGPPGTLTPFHHDLTNNFMAQVIGRKRVKVVPSWDMPLMQIFYHTFSKADGRVMPPTPKPTLNEPQVLECILAPGEILFLPIGCMHFVEGLDVSVTVSFTNFLLDNEFFSFYTTYHEV